MAAVVALAGCDHPASRTVAGPEAVEVAGELGAVPTVTFEVPLVVEEKSVTTVIDGGGVPIPEGAPVLVDWVAYDGSTGDVLSETYTTAPQVLSHTEDSMGEDLYGVLDDAGFGDRLLVLEPTAGEAGVPGSAVTVLDARAARASGVPVPPREGLPIVTLAEDGAPSVTIPATPPPAGLQQQVLIKGAGEQVEADSELLIQYTAVNWADGSVRATTWGAGLLPELREMSGAITGLQEGLLDQTVGSQVLLVVPPDEAYGDHTVVLVVDILAVVHEPQARPTPSPTPSATSD